MKASERLKAFSANMAESMASPLTASDRTPVRVSGPSRYQATSRLKNGLQIPLDLIDPDPEQPRKEFEPEAIEQLAASLRKRGQLQPCRVRWDDIRSRWIIVAGERRYRAAKLAGLKELLAVEATGPLSPEERLDEQLTENCLREDLKPIEKAKAFRKLMDRFELTQKALAERLNISVASVSRALAILGLPEETQQAVDAGEIPAETAYQIVQVKDKAEQGRLTELAKAGRVTREDIRRPSKVEYRTKHGTVTVAGTQSREQVGKALAEAARIFRLEKNEDAA